MGSASRIVAANSLRQIDGVAEAEAMPVMVYPGIESTMDDAWASARPRYLSIAG
jgi:hypothetical protein